MRSGGKLLHVYVAAHAASASAAVGIVFVDDRGDVVRRVGRRLQEPQPEPARDLAAFRGILHALWNARRQGCRRVIVHSDHPEVVAQINGVCEVRFGLIGPYLEVRALLHAYRSARVEVDVSGRVEEARACRGRARHGCHRRHRSRSAAVGGTRCGGGKLRAAGPRRRLTRTHRARLASTRSPLSVRS